eukprot:scaffold29910_cov53-Phaeocystis_antarctica.AAC.3
MTEAGGGGHGSGGEGWPKMTPECRATKRSAMVLSFSQPSENCSQREPCGWARVGLSRAVSRAMVSVTSSGPSAHHGSMLV